MQFENPKKSAEFTKKIEQAHSKIASLVDNIETVIKGKREIIEDVVMVIVANGHVLLRDVPGVGKTLLAKSLSKSINTNFRRIQFTPDLLPTDITGVNIFNEKKREFEFQPGPVFTNVLLADEINRASPKTQSALLEAMEERQVSIDNVIYKLPKFFFVIATQNPIEHAGTYPLPAAQLDRFMKRLSIGYPAKETELEILQLHTQNINPLDKLEAVVDENDIISWQETANEIYTAPEIDNYIIDLARATREDAQSGYGVSTRAALLLKKAARASAMISSRDYVIPDDVHRVIKQVFSHRIGGSEKVGEAVVEQIMTKVTI
ncbi:AAA family ATPase [Candidatus Dojkabacteria bacterium]|nr:AAA family ATPase [Candidatus Dojkabacteria bacterium]